MTAIRSRIDKEILANGPAFIEAIAASGAMKEKYGRRPEASKGHVRNAIIFGILTANERYEAAEHALEVIRGMEWYAPVTEWLKRSGIIFYNEKARAIEEFAAAFDHNPTPYHPYPEETCSQYRDRLLTLNIRGLGFVKTSFAAYLAYGGGDVICADRHILNLYTSGGFKDWMHKRSSRARNLLKKVESDFVDLALKYEWPSASALQWAVWCEAIGEDTSHDAVSI